MATKPKRQVKKEPATELLVWRALKNNTGYYTTVSAHRAIGGVTPAVGSVIAIQVNGKLSLWRRAKGPHKNSLVWLDQHELSWPFYNHHEAGTSVEYSAQPIL